MKTNQWYQPMLNGAKFLVPAAVLLLALALYVPEKILAAKGNAVDNGRIVQVVLSEHAKISQFDDIDSSPTGYGKNACGLVAVAAAVGGETWTSYLPMLAYAAGSSYGQASGIQPTPLTNALQKVFGVTNVTAYNNGTLEAMYNELQEGNIVIVDLKVNSLTSVPSSQAPNFAHFARVLGMDMGREEIYLENTLRGGAYWTVSFKNFAAVWQRPETSVSEIPIAQPEDVTNWYVVLDRSLLNANAF